MPLPSKPQQEEFQAQMTSKTNVESAPEKTADPKAANPSEKPSEPAAPGTKAATSGPQTRLAKDKVSAILAIALTAGVFALVGILAFHAIPESSKALIDTLLGALAAAWVAMIHYYFGSSAGSAAKNQMIADQLQKKQ